METDNESFDTDEPRSSRSWLKGIGWCLLVVAIFAAVFFLRNHGKGSSKLQQALAELDRTEPGWRLEDIEAARAKIPEEENSARVVVAAADRIPRGWPPRGFTDRLVRLEPQEQLAAEDSVRLRMELSRVRPALDIAGKLADMPRGRYQLHFTRNPIEILCPDQQKSRDIFKLLIYGGYATEPEGRVQGRPDVLSCRAQRCPLAG